MLRERDRALCEKDLAAAALPRRSAGKWQGKRGTPVFGSIWPIKRSDMRRHWRR